MREKKILLIASVFPPNYGIGGRRWAKFVKILLKEGYKVYVLKPEQLGDKVSLWNEDVSASKDLKIFSFPLMFQKILFNPQKNIFTKIFWNLFYKIFNLSKYYCWDTSSISMNRMEKAAHEIIVKENIKLVIITGNPYYHYVGVLLKKRLKKDIRIILDYRDLWNDHSFFKIYFKRSKKQADFSNYIENEALKSCDCLITVDDYLMSTVSNRLQNKYVKKIIIPNGFDTDDYKKYVKKRHGNERRGNLIKLFFAGSLAEDLSPIVKLFIKNLLSLQERNLELFKKIHVEIYCNSNNHYINELANKKLPNNICIYSTSLEVADYVRKLQEAEYGLLFSSIDYANSFFTKFYDYLFLKKRMINVGYIQGDFAGFIEKNNLGVNFIENQCSDFFFKLEEDYNSYNKKYLNDEFINQFDIKTLASKLIQALEELNSF